MKWTLENLSFTSLSALHESTQLKIKIIIQQSNFSAITQANEIKKMLLNNKTLELNVCSHINKISRTVNTKNYLQNSL